jgi:hypothetical protein
LREPDFFADDLRAPDSFADDLRALDFLAVDLRALDYFADDLRALDFFADFFAGTLAPARRASDNPIAMACLRLFTFLPELPLRSFPVLRSCMTFLTFACAFLAYFAMSPPR